MKNLYFLFLCFTLSFAAKAQTIVLYYNWENTDPKVAVVGPNATSVGSFANTKTRIDGNSKGLTPGGGTNKQDILLTIPSVAQFNVKGIDLSFDYQRDETTATIFKRGNFIMGANDMNVKYRVTEAGGGCSAVISSPNFSIADDDVYRNYRFTYDPTSGVGTLYRDNTQLWTNTGTETPNQDLCWTDDGEIVIGTLMDGGGKGNALMDNLLLQEPNFQTQLPIELTDFAAIPENGQVNLNWTTATEIDNDYFEVERSATGSAWEALGRVTGSGTSASTNRYDFTDRNPLTGTSFYRLRQVDFGQTYTYSLIAKVAVHKGSSSRTGPVAFPNPTAGVLEFTTTTSEQLPRVLDPLGRSIDLSGRMKRSGTNTYRLDLTGLSTGIYRILDGEFGYLPVVKL
ncbi:hypothetical protein GGR28_001704 [Lewinella aquimaris]|uniref:Uncharacterized protein n=1 Tax=Neolewinella aquimaris TaxID=1835722 RepID=A0A840E783_9BACT|nr:hypothetical protein [Neolewinella aquimaris]MBB4079087.1 hypothetical protein [Neolewinella aquimaris]